MRLWIALLFSVVASAQTAVWPGSAATDSQLLVGANLCQTRLSQPINDTTSTTIFVTNSSVSSPYCFVVNQEVQVDNEFMKVTSVAFGQMTVTRGFDYSTASTHQINAPVVNNVAAAWYHNALAKEVESIEAWLSANPGFLPAAGSLGNVLVSNGTTWAAFAANSGSTRCFQEDGSGNPSWGACGSGSSGVLTPTFSGIPFANVSSNTLVQTTIGTGLSLNGTTLSVPTVSIQQYPYNAKCDGTTDDAAAINAATLAYKANAGNVYIVQLAFPTNQTCRIGSTVHVYSGEVIQGYGATIKALNGFSGTNMFDLPSDGSGYYKFGIINGLNFDDTANSTRLTAIQAIAADIVDSQFTNTTFNTGNGLICNTYCQQNTINNLESVGPIDNFITVYGNFNLIEDNDKEGISGTAVGCYINIGALGTATPSDNNILIHNLIEGSGNSNKSALCITNALDTEVRDIWIEIAPLNGIGVNLNTTQNTKFYDRLLYLSTTQVLNLVASTNVYVDQMDSGGPPYNIYQAIVADAASNYSVKRGITRSQQDNYIFSALNKGPGMDSVYMTGSLVSTPGLVPVSQHRDMSAQNLLINGALEAGEYGYIFSSTTNLIHSLVASQFDAGQMEQISTSGSGNYTLYQNVTVPAAWVGRMMSFSVQVAVSGSGTEYANAYVSGAGVTSSGSYNRINIGNAGLLTIQFMPQSAGTLSVGVTMFNMNSATSSQFNIDDFNLAFGSVGMNDSAMFGSFELNKVPMTYGSAAPSTGTWPLGAIVWNNNPVTNAGWICITAGSPGTWTTIQLTLPTNFPMVLVSPTGLTGFTTAQTATSFYTTTGPGLYRISISTYVSTAATGGSSPTLQAQLSLAGGPVCNGTAYGSNARTIDAGSASNCSTVIFLPSSQVISWSTVFGGSAGTPPTYSVYPTVEQLH